MYTTLIAFCLLVTSGIVEEEQPRASWFEVDWKAGTIVIPLDVPDDREVRVRQRLRLHAGERMLVVDITRRLEERGGGGLSVRVEPVGGAVGRVNFEPRVPDEDGGDGGVVLGRGVGVYLTAFRADGFYGREEHQRGLSRLYLEAFEDGEFDVELRFVRHAPQRVDVQ